MNPYAQKNLLYLGEQQVQKKLQQMYYDGEPGISPRKPDYYSRSLQQSATPQDLAQLYRKRESMPA